MEHPREKGPSTSRRRLVGIPRHGLAIGIACAAVLWGGRWAGAHGGGGDALPVVDVTSDDTPVDRSCRIRIAPGLVIPDADGDGVLHVVRDGITVVFEAGSELRGAPAPAPPERLSGTGIRLVGRRGVHLVGLRVSGYKVGVHATRADALEVRDADLSGNFRQRLASTPRREDTSDWLSPHHNDAGEWRRLTGAALCVEDSEGIVVRRVRARRGQNGIVLDRVGGSWIYDNDCSFLSGWGLALWRSSDNAITRNAFDFCVRGYSHGVYNRGQDSAGILMFEQCCRNLIAENSATHGGDGFFGLAGLEALGQEGLLPELDRRRRGNDDNLLWRNDFSFAAAHGIEMTFSFGNRFIGNRLAGNAICGVWGGYSQETLIAGNRIEENGSAGYGAERGGVNIEHGVENRIVGNQFRGNACGVRLWWDPDEGLTHTPWAAANSTACRDNEIAGNVFAGDRTAVELRACGRTTMRGNRFTDVTRELDADTESLTHLVRPESGQPAGDSGAPAPAELEAVYGERLRGETHPVGARAHLGGREAIVLDDYGPWDHESPLLRLLTRAGARHRYELRGVDMVAAIVEEGAVLVGIETASTDASGHAGALVAGVQAASDGVQVYRVRLAGRGFERTISGVLIPVRWRVTFFPWTADPRQDLAGWRAQAQGEGAVTVELDALDLPFGGGGPRDLRIPAGGAAADELRQRGPGPDHFGTIARCRLELPAGRWQVRTRSDDGVRVTADGAPLIEDWTWHPPRTHEAVLELAEKRTVALEVEHFELDGHAVLQLQIEPAPLAPPSSR